MRQIIPFVRNPPLQRSWTEARARKATLDRLQKVVDLLAEIAALWGDVDESICNDADSLIEEVALKARDLQEYWAEKNGDAA